MVRPREFDESQALDNAMHIFWEKGYEATSLSDLTSCMGIGRTSLYAAFGDKKELFVEALRKYSQWNISYAKAKLESVSSVRDAFRSYFDETLEQAYNGTPFRGCFCVNTMVELAPHDTVFEKTTREFQLKLAETFQHKLEQGIHSGELSSTMDAAAVAQTLTVFTIGLVTMLKSQPDRTFVENSLNVMFSVIK